MGNQRGRHIGKSEQKKGGGGLDVKFYTFGGGWHYFFHFLSLTGKRVEAPLGFEEVHLFILELTILTSGVLITELADY